MTAHQSLNVLIAEDHEMFREGLSALCNQLGEQIDVKFAANFAETLTHCQNTPILDLILLDLKLPGVQRLEGLKVVRSICPLTPIVVISALEQQANVHNVMQLGANAFISKSIDKNEMLVALQRVLSGESLALTNDNSLEQSHFTQRQLDVLYLLIEGLNNKEIGDRLGISHATVRQHVTQLLVHFGVNNRVQVATAAKTAGFVID